MQVILLIDMALVGLLLYFRLKENVPSRHVLFQAGGGLLLIFTWITTFIFCGGANPDSNDFLRNLYHDTNVWQAVQNKFYYVVLLLTIIQLIHWGAKLGRREKGTMRKACSGCTVRHLVRCIPALCHPAQVAFRISVQ